VVRASSDRHFNAKLPNGPSLLRVAMAASRMFTVVSHGDGDVRGYRPLAAGLPART